MVARGSVLIEHGYQLMGDGSIVPKPCRPRTKGEAREYIVEIFDGNQWDERDRRKFLEMHGVELKDDEELSVEEMRIILDAMEKSRMILFND